MDGKIGQTFYFVYVYHEKNEYGLGACKAHTDHDIPTYEDIINLSDKIKEDFKYDNVIIINWQLLDDFSEDNSEENKE